MYKNLQLWEGEAPPSSLPLAVSVYQSLPKPLWWKEIEREREREGQVLQTKSKGMHLLIRQGLYVFNNINGC